MGAALLGRSGAAVGGGSCGSNSKVTLLLEETEDKSWGPAGGRGSFGLVRRWHGGEVVEEGAGWVGREAGPGRPLTLVLTAVHAWTHHRTEPSWPGGKGFEQAQRGPGRPRVSAHPHAGAGGV